MKKILRSQLFTFVLGALIFSSIGVVTATQIFANQIVYTKNGQSTVEGALDTLYNKSKYLTEFCELKSGTALTVGSKYECDPGDGIKRNFYILEVRQNEVDLIMEQNIVAGAMVWYDAMKYFTDTEDGINIKNAWTNVLNIDLPKAQAIANAVGNSEWKATTNNAWWCLETRQRDSESNPICYNSTQNTMWLWDYTRNCSSYNCSHGLSSGSAYGYWTRDAVVNTNKAWIVDMQGTIGGSIISYSLYGIRPVITVLKSNLYTATN